MLGLRLNHPAGQDDLELLPVPARDARRGRVLVRAAPPARRLVAREASSRRPTRSRCPTLTPWQQRILTTAVHYVGYPYVWGGTSPTAETLFGVHSAGGFDCSGFVWRVYKLTPYPGERGLAGVLRGRTTYQMSGEVPRARSDPGGEAPACAT